MVELRNVAAGLWEELPFEHVIVSHGEPLHTRADYERALVLPPWSGW